MSVMSQLKEFSSAPGPQFQRGFIPDVQNAENAGSVGEMMEDNPIPGQSLTQDPEQRLPYETPAEYTEVQPFIDDLFMEITEPDMLDGILGSLRNNVPVEEAAKKILSSKFQKGKISVDLLLLAIEPTILMLIALGVHSGVDVQLLPGESDNPDIERDQLTERYLAAAKSIGDKGDIEPGESLDIQDLAGLQLTPDTPKNLMQRAAEAAESVGQGSLGNPSNQGASQIGIA